MVLDKTAIRTRGARGTRRATAPTSVRREGGDVTARRGVPGEALGLPVGPRAKSGGSSPASRWSRRRALRSKAVRSVGIRMGVGRARAARLLPSSSTEPLHIPPDGTTRAAVALVHGSGKATRDVWRTLASRMALAGIASLRYDKPGWCGQSEGDWTAQGFRRPRTRGARRTSSSQREPPGTRTLYWAFVSGCRFGTTSGVALTSRSLIRKISGISRPRVAA